MAVIADIVGKYIGSQGDWFGLHNVNITFNLLKVSPKVITVVPSTVRSYKFKAFRDQNTCLVSFLLSVSFYTK